MYTLDMNKEAFLAGRSASPPIDEDLVSERVFRASEVQRDYRALLDSAREAPVTVIDRDGRLIGVEPWADLQLGRQTRARLRELHQFLTAYRRFHDDDPAAWVELTPFPWLAPLPKEAVSDFAEMLMPVLAEAVAHGDLDEYAGMLRGWQSSAETWGDEAIESRMRAPIDPKKLVEVFPPESTSSESA